MAGLNKIVNGVDKIFLSKGAKEKTQKSLTEFHQTIANANKTAKNLQEATSGLPTFMKKANSFLDNLSKAGKGLPGLVNSAQTTLGDVDKTAKAAQKTWLLRSHVPQPKEHTIRMDADPGKD